MSPFCKGKNLIIDFLVNFSQLVLNNISILQVLKKQCLIFEKALYVFYFNFFIYNFYYSINNIINIRKISYMITPLNK